MVKTTKQCTACSKNIKIESEDNIPKYCPNCNRIYWEKPNNERKLKILQDKYLQNREDSILGEMIIILEEITMNLVRKRLRGTFVVNKEDVVQDVAYESILKILEYYKEKPEFRIDDSFTGYMSQVILYPLYNDKKQEREHAEISLSTVIGHSEGSKQLTLEDKISNEIADHSSFSTETSFMSSTHQENIVNSLGEFLDNIFMEIMNNQGLRNAIINWMLLNHYFNKKPNRFFNHCWEFYPESIKINYENSIYMVREFLMEENHVKEGDLE